WTCNAFAPERLWTPSSFIEAPVFSSACHGPNFCPPVIDDTVEYESNFSQNSADPQGSAGAASASTVGASGSTSGGVDVSATGDVSTATSSTCVSTGDAESVVGSVDVTSEPWPQPMSSAPRTLVRAFLSMAKPYGFRGRAETDLRRLPSSSLRI